MQTRWLIPFLSLPFIAGLSTSAADAPYARLEEKHRVFLKENCTECHNEQKQKGKLRLDDISFTLDSIENADRWQKILNQINSEEMPPEDAKQPERGAKTEFLDSLSHTLMAARRSLGDSGGKITMRRLNRREYKNTIRDLLGVDINVRDLPADGGAGTFDTVGSSLFMSSDQFEQYLTLGRQALDEHFARYVTPSGAETNARATTFKSHREPEEFANKQVSNQVSGFKLSYERYQQWTAAVDVAAALPENAALAAELRRLDRVKKNASYFYSEWMKRKTEPSPTKFGFRDVDDGISAKTGIDHYYRYWADYLALPHKDTGAYLTIYRVHEMESISAHPKWPAGNYAVRVRIAALDDAPKERRFIEVFQRGQASTDLTVVSSHQVTGTMAQPQVLEIPVNVPLTGNREFAIREKQPNSRSAAFDAWKAALDKTGTGPKPALWIDWVELEGPLNKRDTKSEPVPVVFANTTNASEHDHALAIIKKFAIRSFRDKAPKPEYIDKLVRLFDSRINAGEAFETALKTPLSVVLASPRFLYLSEPAEEKKPRTLTPPELATRLSYFLWSAPPDEALLALARSGDLMKPEVLAHEVDRMIASEKANQFVSGFVHQWLGMERLDFFQFDTKQFRDFDESAKAASRREVYETFAHLLRANGSVRDLLKCDYVIVNGLLATYYGIDGVSGDEFRKVSLTKDSPRGGLLGMAAIMAMGSNGERSSPVERGAWVLRKLLHDSPPPAPPNVPQITRLNGQLLTTRERLLAHQEQPQCASCHRAIDPIGFGLENFNAVGKWRTEDSYQALDVNGKPIRNQIKTWNIDASAAFHKGPAFKNYFELRNLIASRPDLLARGLTENLIAYGLGRPFAFTDQELANTILQRGQRAQFGMRDFVQALVASKEFHSK